MLFEITKPILEEVEFQVWVNGKSGVSINRIYVERVSLGNAKH